ncbi:MAG TPA: nitroreductase family deazaflavin-dependent oxidoreductase [Acidimicrobiia bacterium]|nr:nitroreductase family deazaflavin-dependent oxidoreductase [Acidimicrobiia bacterium]
MSDLNNWNTQIIEEFRANGGQVGGRFEGVPMLLLHTTGARTGETRINPLAYQPHGDNLVIFASYAGAPKNPAWFHNLMAGGPVSVEVGTEAFPVRARVTEGSEREKYWSKQKQDFPTFAEYEQKTDREIPVIVLERAD